MGRALEIAQWVLIFLIIVYLILGTYFMSISLERLQDQSEAYYTVKGVTESAKRCWGKDYCAYGESYYNYDKGFLKYDDKENYDLYFIGCMSKDKLTTPKDIPKGTECSCISNLCESIS